MIIRDLQREMMYKLADIGVENTRFEMEQLLEKAGLSRLRLLTDPSGNVPEKVERAALEMLGRRVSGYPLQYILGEWEFFGLPF